MALKLEKLETKAPKSVEEADIVAKTEKMAEKIAEKVEILYAQKKHSLLVILQGMDASGKDGVTKTVFGRCSPAWVDAFGFKKPTPDEMAHDFLWRVHKEAPAKGMVKVFIRSHYEDVLIQKVHGWISEEKCKNRYKAINAWEKLLVEDNNTTILKLFLNISPEKQLEKLTERVEDPTKNWKHNDGDWAERKLWPEYAKAFNKVFEECDEVNWSNVPADSRWYRNYVASKLVLEALEKMDLAYPKLDPKPNIAELSK